MTTLAIKQNQTKLLDELVELIPLLLLIFVNASGQPQIAKLWSRTSLLKGFLH